MRRAPGAIFVMGVLALCLRARGAPAGEIERLEAAVLDVERDYFEAIEISDAARLESLTRAVEDAAPPRAATRPLLTALHRRDAPIEVAQAAQRLLQTIERRHPLPVPSRQGDLDHGRALYRQDCAACHGVDGDAPSRPGLAATPSFREDEVMNQLSPSEVYLLLGYGVPETAMPSFELLSEQERWDVSFYLFTLRPLRCRGAVPKLSLAERSRTRDQELAARFGDGALACLRGHGR